MSKDIVMFTKLIQEKLDSGIEFFDFEGNNCSDTRDYLDENSKECRGWNGENRRCECGNRRVSWVLSDDGLSIYAEAY